MSPPIVADTGGLLRALERTPEGRAGFPEYEPVLTSASRVLVPALVLAEVDYFLRQDRGAIHRLVAELFDPNTRYEYELPLASDLVRALEFDAQFRDVALDWSMARWRNSFRYNLKAREDHHLEGELSQGYP